MKRTRLHNLRNRVLLEDWQLYLTRYKMGENHMSESFGCLSASVLLSNSLCRMGRIG